MKNETEYSAGDDADSEGDEKERLVESAGECAGEEIFHARKVA